MKAASTSGRPLLITLICAIGLLFLLCSFVSVNHFLDDSFIEFSSIVTLASLIGIWKMKRLALYIYSSVFAVNQFVAVYLEHWMVQATFIPLAIIGITAFYHNKMN